MDLGMRLAGAKYNAPAMLAGQSVATWGFKCLQEGTHNLTHEQAIDMLIRDVRSRGIRIETPSDPLHDPQFIRTLISARGLNRGSGRY